MFKLLPIQYLKMIFYRNTCNCFLWWKIYCFSIFWRLVSSSQWREMEEDSSATPIHHRKLHRTSLQAQNQAAVPRSFVFSWKSAGKTARVHPGWGTCFCWKWTERNVGFQRYHSCKATAGDSYSLPGTVSTTRCTPSVFTPAPFIRELYSLAHSEQHTAGNDTRSIIHTALNFISFAVKINK